MTGTIDSHLKAGLAKTLRPLLFHGDLHFWDVCSKQVRSQLNKAVHAFLLGILTRLSTLHHELYSSGVCIQAQLVILQAVCSRDKAVKHLAIWDVEALPAVISPAILSVRCLFVMVVVSQLACKELAAWWLTGGRAFVPITGRSEWHTSFLDTSNDSGRDSSNMTLQHARAASADRKRQTNDDTCQA